MQKKYSLPVFVLVITALSMAACAPAASSTAAAPTKPATAPTEAPAAATAVPATEVATTSANVDFSTVKSAEEAGGMDALIAAAKAEGELMLSPCPAIGALWRND